MNDSEYARVFSIGVDRVMKTIGITDEFRENEQYTIYTLETHLCYLQETMEGNPLRITFQLLDHDEKRLHVFFVMEDKGGNRLATSEQMLMGIDLKERRPAPFPPVIMKKIKAIAEEDKKIERPKEAGRVIGIRRK
ncbi:3-hydroxyacyl-CoA dehydrogenase [Pueribacillus theae]|uniref:3-hydroxyacyl-CoA dehydrogenase n=2 Tax=Pueribacillus theae TaxID=2171751 RepID=A0A2U1JIM0_9BACI|nr:thioesterase family protein [Pueribacillus theae]PWA04991.1 3-hydroxyacyl-CoA dehydrogenase [Pueribacillus theae]